MKNNFRKRSILLLLFLVSLLAIDSKAQWLFTGGPQSMPLSISCIAVSGTNIFAGSTAKGVYLSTNDGQNWNICGLKDLSISSLTVKNNKIFATTGGLPGPGDMFVSSDNGQGWTKITGSMNPFVNCSAASGMNLYAGCVGLMSNPTGGFYISSNDGASWSAVNSGFQTYMNTLFGNDQFIFACTKTDLYRAPSNGSPWVRLLTQKVNSLTTKGIYLFAGTDENGIYRSSNDGNSWEQVNSGLSSLAIRSVAGNEEFVYAGTPNGIFMSSNNGDNWSPINSGLTNPDTKYLTLKNNVLFAASDKGISHSTNNGTNWLESNLGLSSPLTVNSINLISTKIFAGTASGISISPDSGSSWNNITMSNRCMGLEENNGYIFAILDGSGVMISSNNGINWTSSNNGLLHLNTMCISKYLSNMVIADFRDGVYMSTNNGVDWNQINNGLPVSQRIRSFAVNDNQLYTAIYNYGVYKYIDNIWVSVNNNLTSSDINFITAFNNVLYVGTNLNGIFKSTDNSLTWSSLGLTGRSVYCLAADKNNIIAGRFDGVFISSNNGAVWTKKNQGFGSDNIYDTYINTLYISDDYVFAGIQNRGAWKRPISDIVGVQNISTEIPDKFLLKQNYPNPFNPTTKLSFSLPVRSFVKLTVYNSIGKEAARLVNENLNAGSYEYEFNGEGLSSGVYFYKLETGSFSETKKMVLLK